MFATCLSLGRYQYLRLPLVFLCVLICQACSSPAATTSGRAGSSVSRNAVGSQFGGATGEQGAGNTGSVVPAVVGSPPRSEESTTYRIGPDDLLKIEVFEVDELSSEERVSKDGVIIMPLIGAVRVGGLTPAEAEQKIAKSLKVSYLEDPQVNVFVSEYANYDVTVTGLVDKPGVFPIKGPTTLLQAIAMAGGTVEFANKKEVIVFRGQGTPNAKAYIVNLDRVEEGTDPDPVLAGNDRVVVPKSGTAVFVKNLTDAVRGVVNIPVLLF